MPYTLAMESHPTPGGQAGPAHQAHLDNVAGNLQLVADMGYGDVALATRNPDGSLSVVADARPMTAVAAVASSRVGRALSAHDEPEAYRALREGVPVVGERRRTTRGISYVTHAYPIGPADAPYGVLLRDLTQLVAEAPQPRCPGRRRFANRNRGRATENRAIRL